jgi:hypothetical protein
MRLRHRPTGRSIRRRIVYGSDGGPAADVVAADFLLGRSNAQMEAGFILKPSRDFDHIPMLYVDIAQA